MVCPDSLILYAGKYMDLIFLEQVHFKLDLHVVMLSSSVSQIIFYESFSRESILAKTIKKRSDHSDFEPAFGSIKLT